MNDTTLLIIVKRTRRKKNTNNGATKVPPLVLKPSPLHPLMAERMKKEKTLNNPPKKNPTPKLNRKYMF
jgi:hypothetical protein